jgi:hypothetical protein
MSQAYYSNSVKKFLLESTDSIKGKLDKGATQHSQIWTIQFPSWESSIEILKNHLDQISSKYPEAENWTILLEYEIPRLLSRIDIVLLTNDLIFVIEFKHGREKFELADERQVEDYALDLKDFHLQSRDKIIIPILLAPNGKNISQIIKIDAKNVVQPTIKANNANLSDLLLSSFTKHTDLSNEKIDASVWENSVYSPTPTIIQAAQALFAGQKVEAITNKGAENLSLTTDYVVKLITKARQNKKKVVCFITGVPGAGKTLVGLNIIHKEEFIEKNKSNAAYFSGNGPLISVLREALTRDEYDTNKIRFQQGKLDEKPSKNITQTKVETKIQNLHSFIKDGLRNEEAPYEKIVVFDEAQRCWDATNFYNKSVQSRVKESNPIRKSEAEIIFEIMDRHYEWAVVIALVGNGQEINTGEAGIGEWGRVLVEKYNHWQIHISPELLLNDTSNSTNALFDKIPDSIDINREANLHLSVSQRSFKANKLNDWVNAVIDNDPDKAKNLYALIEQNYPIFITGDLPQAKDWLNNLKQGNKRIGLIASSGALRLRPYGINTKEDINVPYWFLNDDQDVRSSYYLEIVATEYKIQGLEIDWAGICWDGDLRRNSGVWDYKNFSGTKWDNVHKKEDRQYLLNKYRVLLTRAREGMIIWIPEGDLKDTTRSPEIYDPIYDYLKTCGVREV